MASKKMAMPKMGAKCPSCPADQTNMSGLGDTGNKGSGTMARKSPPTKTPKSAKGKYSGMNGGY